MHPIRRRVSSATAAAALLLCLAAVGMWVRSLWFAQDDMYWSWLIESPGHVTVREAFVHSTRGSLGLFVLTNAVPPQYQLNARNWVSTNSGVHFRPWLGRNEYLIYSGPPAGFLGRVGFAVVRVSGGTIHGTGVDVPWWFVALGWLIIAFACVRKRLRWRLPPGCCRGCGYDLRATPTRCPECGLVPQQVPNRLSFKFLA
jgi:hypothetical protein